MKNILIVSVFLLTFFSCAREEQNVTDIDESVISVDTLVTVIQIGTEYGDSTNTFGMIVDAAIDNAGNILILDRTFANLRLFDSQGKYVRNVTRSGNGPGELNLPWDMFHFEDGRLMVLDPGKRGFIVFDDSLQLIEELNLWQQNPPFQSCAVSDSQFASFKAKFDVTENDVVIDRKVVLYTYGQENYDLLLWQDSLVLPRVEVRNDPSLIINNVEEPIAICSNGSGIVYFTLKNGEDYFVTAWNTEGAEVLSISLELEPVAKNMEEIRTESEYITGWLQNNGSNVEPNWAFNPKPFKDMIVGIYIGPDDNLWVRRGNTETPFFDIFNPANGELLKQAIFMDNGYSWKFEISRNGILAWEVDPENYYQALYRIQ